MKPISRSYPEMPPAAASKRKRAGFTLIEVMISIIIFTLSMGGSYGLMRWVVHSTTHNVRATNASFIAQDKMEELRNQHYALITGGSDAVGRFNRAWSVSTSMDQKTITINVSWLAQNQITTRDVEITSIVARP